MLKKSNSLTSFIIGITNGARAFGSKQGDTRWDAKADLDNNGEANIVDITTVATNFGKKT